MKIDRKVCLLFLSSFAIRAVFLFLTDNICGDPAGKIIASIEWLKDPKIITYGFSLPLHHYMISLIIFFFDSPDISTRILSLLFGSLSIFPFYFLVEMLFGSSIAFYSSIFFVFLYHHILYSTQTMGDTIFLFFSISSLFYFFKSFYNAKVELKHTVYSSLLLMLAGMIRIEAWVLIPFMVLVIVSEKRFMDAIIFASLTLFFPFTWLAGNLFKTGVLLPIATININITAFQGYSLIKKLFIYPYIIMKTLTPIAATFAFAGLALAFIKKINRRLGLLIIAEIFFLTSTVLVGTNAFPKPRYCLFAATLLIPFCIFYIKALSSKMPLIAKIAVLILIISIPFTYSYFFLTNRKEFLPRMPQSQIEISQWLKANAQKGDKIFIDSFSWWNSNIAVVAGVDPYSLARIYADPYNVIVTSKKFYRKRDYGVKNYLNEEHPMYIIYEPKGIFSQWIGRFPDSAVNTLSFKKYKKIFSSEKYVILKSVS